MHEKKNKFSQFAPILDEISVRLLDTVHHSIDEKYTIFLQNTHFWRLFWRI